MANKNSGYLKKTQRIELEMANDVGRIWKKLQEIVKDKMAWFEGSALVGEQCFIGS